MKYSVPDTTVTLPGTYMYSLVGWYDDLSTNVLAKAKVTLATNANENLLRITSLQTQTNGMLVRWVGGQPPYTLYLATNLTTTTTVMPNIASQPPATGPGANWTPVGPAQPGDTEMVAPGTNASGFFRVKDGHE